MSSDLKKSKFPMNDLSIQTTSVIQSDAETCLNMHSATHRWIESAGPEHFLLKEIQD